MSSSPSLGPTLYHEAVRKYLYDDNNDNINNNNQDSELHSFAFYKCDSTQIRFIIHIIFNSNKKKKKTFKLHILSDLSDFAYLKISYILTNIFLLINQK